MDWPWPDRPAPVVRLAEEERAFGGIGQLYAWRRYPDGSWWGYVKWTRQLSAQERGHHPERLLEACEAWLPAERFDSVAADYRRVPREVWDPQINGWQSVSPPRPGAP